MSKFTKIFFVILFLFCFTQNNAYSKINDLLLDYDIVKEKWPLKKKIEPKPKMVETKDEWDLKAQNVPLEERELKDAKEEKDTKKFHIPDPKFIFEAYNYPQGKRELNIETVKKDLYYHSYIVADKTFHYGAYAHYFYSPDSNQISSRFYVEELDTSKNKTERIQKYKHIQKERIPIVDAGTKEIYYDYFKGLTLVDWSADSKKVLIKEKMGSMRNGIYKTYLYVHFLKDEVNSGYTIKLDDLDMAIKHYFLDWENKQLIKYRYDIEPLGFSAENDNMILAICYVYDSDGNKVFLGLWGYDCIERKSKLISRTKINATTSVNGFYLKQVVE